MVDVRMPDGVVVRFPDDMPREQVRDLIATKFPQLAQQHQAQARTAPVPMPLPSFRQGNQATMPPMPRPRPMLGMGPGGNQRTYEIQAPDGRKITIRAIDEQTAIRGAQEWVAANPMSQPAANQAPQGQQQPGSQTTLNIGGQRVKVGNEFMQMSPEMQNQTVDEIAGQIGVRPNGTGTNPQNFGGGQPIEVQLPDGGIAKFPAGMSQADIEAVLQREYPPPGGGNTVPSVSGQPGMKRFEVKTPDGRTFEVTAPDMESASASIAEYLAGASGQQQAARGPSQEWLRQNPDLADLPIPGTTSRNSPPPSQGPQPRTGAFENATAGLNNALYSVAGFPVDAANTAMRIGAAGINAATGSDIQLPENTVGGRQSIADAFGQVGVADPANVVPANNFERSLRAGGEGAGYAVAPELVFAQLSKLGIVGAKAQQLMGQIFGEARTVGGTTGNMVAGATSGMGAQIAADAAPEEWKGTAALSGGLTGAGVGTLATQLPRLAGAGGRAIGDFLAPFTQGGREQMAGQQLRKGSTSPGAVIDAITNAPTEVVSGSKSTTFQMTGDMGIGGMERGAAANNPAEFMQRYADQNAARIGAIEGMQPTGAPETIVTAVRSHMKQIDDELEAAVTGAARNAQGKVAAIGQGATPDIAGGNMRNSLEAARTAAKARERALWDAVDPDGTLALSTSGTKAQTARIIKEMPASAKPPEGEEAAIMGAVRQFGDTMPFSEITALQSRIKTQMRAERIANGESPAYRRLTQLNGAIQQDLETAIAGKVQQQAEAVAAGQMSFEDTIAASITRQQQEWYAARSQGAVGLTGEAGAGFNGRSGPAPLSGSFGAERQTGPGFRTTSRAPGLSPNAGQPNFDRAALDRLNTARQATKQRVETFDNSTLGPIRRRPGTTSPYDMPASAVPAQIFNPSPKSVDALRSYRAAVGDGPALTQLQDYAIDRLRKVALREDGTFDPGKVASWRRSHADVLRSFPQFDASLADAARASETLASVVASREAARAEAGRGILGRIMGLNSPDDVTRAVGSLFGRQDSQNLMMKLVMALGKSPEAKEGLRKAVVDYVLMRFVGNTEAATSRLGTIKSDQLQTFINQNKGALRIAGFGDEELKLMDNIAEDLQRANRSLASVKLPGGSNTTQDMISSRAGKDSSVMLRILLASAGGGAGVGMLSNSMTGAAAMLGAGVVGAMRQKGIHTVNDLVKDALLNPERARLLMMKASPGNIKLAGPSMTQQYRRAALASLGASATP
ncbi:hypothetical protein [Devosia sp.]|uniref:hypothetical protein n=1 Tax=Devosia sp. TaxID=1871048 RepID=UPI00293056AA|nr:hypothetical protein [Devosia sp.]